MSEKNQHQFHSLGEAHSSVDTTIVKGNGWRKILAFFGPAYLVSVGYMDPGNWATDISGGSQFGYKLIWVLLMSNLMALLLQNLSARLGIVRGRDLAQANRETYPRIVNYILYGMAEIAIAATDLAEILGMAIGIKLLTHLPLIWGVLITVLDTFLFLLLQRLGMRKMEAFIIALIAVIGLSFLIEIILAKPPMGEVVKGLIPSLPGNKALYIAIGIIGATVMPHNLYLHSALVQTRKIKRDEAGIKKALRWNFFDSFIALNLAFLVNAAILILAASVFFTAGKTDVAKIEDAHRLLAPMLGTSLAPILFAVALIASGQSSTITGTLAGQVVMEGYLKLRINPWVRRLLTRLIAIIPAVIVILINGENNIDGLLIFSQVILSLQLGFAIIPLIHFTSDKQLMGTFAIKPLMISLASLVTAVLIYLNFKMVIEQAAPLFDHAGQLGWKIIVILAAAFFLFILGITLIFPFLKKKKSIITLPHPLVGEIRELVVPEYHTIAIALDFSENDMKLIAHGLGQGHAYTKYLLIHVVESASTRILGEESDDLETRKDQEQINTYAGQLKSKGITATGVLGFNDRAREIIRIVKEGKADMLVIGAHGHTGLKDLIFGQTIETVRHELRIPVLVVSI